jgi:hypothetical protein
MAIILKPESVKFTGFFPPRGDNARTGQGATKALQYAPCNPGFIPAILHIAESFPVKKIALGIYT